MPKLLRSGRLGVSVALVQASMPDADGNISLGATVDLTHDVLASARLKIAEINPNVPFSLGNSLVSLETFDACVYSEMPIVEAPPPARAGPAETAIADRVVSLIASDSTVQLGIGSLALEVAKRLQRRRNLGIHSGILTDELMDLIVAGAADGSAKEIDSGRAVTGGLVGTRRLYDFVDHNPEVALRETSYLLSEEVLANFGRFVSINSAFQVDLSGQVNAESRSGHVAGAVGGQIDYVRAARRSTQGISVIALRSTTSTGESRIVTGLDRGVVTTARSEVDLVVTEHGIAESAGASLTERALRLVAVADPSHRRRLLDELRRAT
jgi:acyl-CoA hydrolase